MKTISALAVAVLGVSAYANPVFVENWDFEDPELPANTAWYSAQLPVVPGWSTTATGGADRGLWNAPARFNQPADYGQVAFIYQNNAFAQQLGVTIQTGWTYSMSFLSGWATGQSAPTGGHAEMWAGGTLTDGVVVGGTMVKVLNIDDIGWSGSSGQLVPLDFDWTADATHAGELLTIRFSKSTSSYWSFDKVEVEAVPEPMTLATLGIGLAAIAARRRRKA